MPYCSFICLKRYDFLKRKAQSAKRPERKPTAFYGASKATAQSLKLIQKLFQIISKCSKLFQINIKIQMFKIQNSNFLILF